jgi:hypothetical protein
MSMPNFRTTIALALFFQLQCCSAYGADSASLEAACQLYSKGDISGCVKLLDLTLAKCPQDPGAHYLKANCLVKLKKLPEASHEYALVEHFAPGSKLAGQAKTAELQLAQFQVKSSVTTIGSTDKKSRNLPPGTIELIRKQVQLARNRAIEMGKTEADNEIKKASNQAMSEQERAERMAQTARQRSDNGVVSSQDAEIIRSRAQANAEQLRLNGEARAAYKEQEARDKAENLKRQAEELEEQLVNDRPYKNREVKLNPIGTNLYTRNYSSTRTPVKALQAEAKELPENVIRRTSANLKLNHGSAAPSAVSSRDGLGAKGTRAEIKVRGEVVPK